MDGKGVITVIKQRRCLLLSAGVTQQTKTRPSKGLFVSGAKSCYVQIYGRYAGCFRPDVKWFFPTNTGFAGNIVKSWGKCAEDCEKKKCNYWTWTSTSCTDCLPNNCIHYYFTSQPEELTESALGQPVLCRKTKTNQESLIMTVDLYQCIHIDTTPMTLNGILTLRKHRLDHVGTEFIYNLSVVFLVCAANERCQRSHERMPNARYSSLFL